MSATSRATLAAPLLAVPLLAAQLAAQGVTTAAIRGVVRDARGAPVDAARVRVVHEQTGYAVEAPTVAGRFTVRGLEPGGPYTVVVRAIGYAPRRRGGLFLALGEPVELDVSLAPAATALDTVRVAAARERAQARAGGGAATTVSDSLVHRLPTLNRNLYDFIALTPQASTRVGLAAGGVSVAGANLRANEFLVDGVSERIVAGNSAPAYGGGKSVPLEAVREYEVLVTPFDVRYGDFAGGLVNTVTRGGTNVLRGAAFAYARNDALARRGESDGGRVDPYERLQYGAVVSGPVVRDRVHFLVAPELQRLSAPARGPYLGQPAADQPQPAVGAADVDRFAAALGAHGLTPGSGGPVTNESPLRNLFARVDADLPRWRSRLVLSHTASRGSSALFSRASPDTFTLSTYQVTQSVAARSTAARLFTLLPRAAASNELALWLRAGSAGFESPVRAPVVLATAPSVGGGTAVLKAGSQEQAHGVSSGSWTAGVSDDLTWSVAGAHEAIVGGRAERVSLRQRGVNNGYGTWTFSSLDSLARGIPQRYDARRDLGAVGRPLAGNQLALYAGDRWRPGDRLTLTGGVRADALLIDSRAPYVPAVDSLFGRRTDARMTRRAHLSPRLGFEWRLDAAARRRLRGGAGVFAGRPPLALFQVALYSYGTGIASLRCGTRATDAGPVPPFVPDYRSAPAACANGTAGPTRGDVDLTDARLGMTRTARASLAYDHAFGGGVTATVEGLLSRSLADLVWVNLNLQGPQGVDRRGRVLYGAVAPTGAASPALVSAFSEVIDVRNTAANHAAQLSASIRKGFVGGLELSASYTLSRVRDVATPIRSGMPGTVNWSTQRALSGRHEELATGVSLDDLPHRVVVAATYATPARRWRTDLSLFYVGESGSPLTYVARGTNRRGDLNADGAVGNDPIYVPRSALDTSEIVFADDASATQQQAFERFVRGTPCLRRQRGRIMARNSCRSPWTNTAVASARQAVPLAGGQSVSVELDVFNPLNLLRHDWGRVRVGTPALLEHVGQTPGPAGSSQPIFHYDVARPEWIVSETESRYQLQLALRYGFR